MAPKLSKSAQAVLRCAGFTLDPNGSIHQEAREGFRLSAVPQLDGTWHAAVENARTGESRYTTCASVMDANAWLMQQMKDV